MRRLFSGGRSDSWAIPLSLGLLSFIAYLSALPQGVVFGDSGELVTASFLNGVAHPTGYPLYVILGHAFSLIPVGSIAFRVGMMSAFFASASVCLVYLAAAKVLKSRIAGAMSAVFLGFSHIFWSQAVIAEVYTMMVFFICLLLYLAVSWKGPRTLYIASFAAGLSLGDHVLAAAVFPGIAYIALAKHRKSITAKSIMVSALLFIMGLSVYLHLPISSMSQPVLNYGDMRDPSTFLSHVTAAEYRGRAGFSARNLLLPVKLGASMFADYSIFCGLALLGAYLLWKKDRAFAVALALTAGLNILLGIAGYSIFTPVHYLPIAVVLSFLLGAGVLCLAEAFPKAMPLFMLIIIVFPVYTFMMYREDVDRSHDTRAMDFCAYVEGALPEGSVFVAQGDNDFFPLLYCRLAEGRLTGSTLLYYRSLLPRVNTDTTLSGVNRMIYSALVERFPGKTVYTTSAPSEGAAAYNENVYPLVKISPDELSRLAAEPELRSEDIHFRQ